MDNIDYVDMDIDKEIINGLSVVEGLKMKKLNILNVNDLLNNSDDEKWYRLNENDRLKFNKNGYYKIKCKEDSYIENIEYVGEEFECEYENVLSNVIGIKDGFEYINCKIIN